MPKNLYLLFVRKSSARAVFSPYQPVSSVLPLRGTSGAIAPRRQDSQQGNLQKGICQKIDGQKEKSKKQINN